MSTASTQAWNPTSFEHEGQQEVYENEDLASDVFEPATYEYQLGTHGSQEEENEDHEDPEEVGDDYEEVNEDEEEDEVDEDEDVDEDEEVDKIDEDEEDEEVEGDDEDMVEEADEDLEFEENQQVDEVQEPHQAEQLAEFQQTDEDLDEAQELGRFPQHFRSSMTLEQPVQSYRCPFPHCHKTFSRSSNLRLHAITHTKYRPVECIPCQKTYKRLNELKIHFKKAHPALLLHEKTHVRVKDLVELRAEALIKRYECVKCHQIFETPMKTKEHFSDKHPRSKWHPSMCQFKPLELVEEELSQWMSFLRDIESIIQSSKYHRAAHHITF